MIGSTRYTTTTEIARQTKLSGDIAKLQEQVSTGKKMSAASEDPNAAARIAEIRRDQANNSVWTKNADTGATIASTVDTQLSTVASALDRANEILLASRSDTSSAATRSTYATELRGIAQDIANYANATDTTGNPLFPDSTPLALPISDNMSIAATASKASVFNLTDASGNTVSISDFLSAAADRLSSATTDGTAISSDISTLGTVMSHVESVRTDQGIRAQRFSDAKDRIASTGTDLSVERSSLEDTDLTYALSEIQSKQLSLQAAQTVFAQTRKSTLFDMIG